VVNASKREELKIRARSLYRKVQKCQQKEESGQVLEKGSGTVAGEIKSLFRAVQLGKRKRSQRGKEESQKSRRMATETFLEKSQDA